ncbi:MAG: hypothetical protein AAFP10_07465 [Pseudomonadota bacterium]
MQRRFVLLLMAGTCWISLSVAYADCFCLQDDAMNIYRACESYQRTTEPELTSYYCRHSRTGEDTSVKNGDTMQKINAGEPGCSPCRQAPSARPEVPRGD